MQDTRVEPLRRILGPVGVALLTLSALSPGASVLIAGADILHHAGTGAALAFLLGGILTLIFTFAQAELGSSFPLAGGDYATIGSALGPRAGFIAFGLIMLQTPVFVATNCTGVSLYLRVIWPQLPVIGTAIGALVLAAALAILNIRTGALLTGAFLAVELVTLALLATLGFEHPVQSLAAIATAPQVFGPAGVAPLTLGALGIAVAAGSWATSGAGQAVYFSEEMHRPAGVGRLVMVIVLLTILSELVPVIGVVLGAGDLHKVFGSESPFTAFIAERASPLISRVVTLGIVAAVFNSIVAVLTCYGRYLYSSGRDRIWPAPVNRAMVRVHKRSGSPWVATLTMAGLSLACCFMGLSMLVVLVSGAGIAIWILINLAAFVGRRRGLTGGRGTYRTPLFPLTIVASLIGATVLAVVAWNDVENGRPGVIAVLVVVTVSALYHQFVLNRRPGGWALSSNTDAGPVPAVARALGEAAPGTT